MKKLNLGKALLLFVAVGLGIAFFHFGWSEYLTLESLKLHRQHWEEIFSAHPFRTMLLFAGFYILTTALSIPGATVLTVAAGAFFGFILGTIIVSFASTFGASLAFLGSRFLLKDFVERRFADRLRSINEGIAKDGAFYLFTLRLLPIFPFFLVNLLMGVTRIRLSTFFWVSQLGMLAGTMVYVNAGTQLAELHNLSDVLSGNIIASFFLIGLLPLLSKYLVSIFQKRKLLKRFKKPKHFDYNIVVIGGGSAGLVASYIAAAVKAKVALIEKDKMGGECLNTGCVPSKALIRAAKVCHTVNNAHRFGVSLGAKPVVDFAKVMERVRHVIQEIAPHDSVERYRGLGVQCFTGDARVLSPFEVKVNGDTLTTKNIVIATGASAMVPALPGLQAEDCLTSDTLWDLRTQPKRLLVLGGGPIGCELAQSFARLGTEVTLVELSARLLNREDPEVSAFVEDRITSEGIKVLTNHKALRVETEGGVKRLICYFESAHVGIDFDQILVALGRKARASGFGLEELGVELTERGTVKADPYLRTNFENIFVCGDVTGPFQFTHAAAHQAWFVAVNALFQPFKKFKADYGIIPWCTFTDPEVARVGLSETEAQEKKLAYKVSRYNLNDLDRAITEGEAQGFVKVLTRENSDRILGVTIVGHQAGDIISEFVTAMKFGFGLNKILNTIHIYPTFAEANKMTAGVWKKQTAPQTVLVWLERFHKWRRS